LRSARIVPGWRLQRLHPMASITIAANVSRR
jgi:hypothetical protein